MSDQQTPPGPGHAPHLPTPNPTQTANSPVRQPTQQFAQQPVHQPSFEEIRQVIDIQIPFNSAGLPKSVAASYLREMLAKEKPRRNTIVRWSAQGILQAAMYMENFEANEAHRKAVLLAVASVDELVKAFCVTVYGEASIAALGATSTNLMYTNTPDKASGNRNAQAPNGRAGYMVSPSAARPVATMPMGSTTSPSPAPRTRSASLTKKQARIPSAQQQGLTMDSSTANNQFPNGSPNTQPAATPQLTVNKSRARSPAKATIQQVIYQQAHEHAARARAKSLASATPPTTSLYPEAPLDMLLDPQLRPATPQQQSSTPQYSSPYTSPAKSSRSASFAEKVASIPPITESTPKGMASLTSQQWEEYAALDDEEQQGKNLKRKADTAVETPAKKRAATRGGADDTDMSVRSPARDAYYDALLYENDLGLVECVKKFAMAGTLLSPESQDEIAVIEGAINVRHNEIVAAKFA